MTIETILQREIEKAAESIVEKRLSEIYQAFASESDEAKEKRKQLSLINAKPLITVSEAAFIIGCSESNIRNKVAEAHRFKEKQRKSEKLVSPQAFKNKFDCIPYIEKSKVGLILFEREKLLAWITSKKDIGLDE